ncbi:hypothetical protein BY458DRAFT_481113 [Sporodiniella umbellata]|nr:hypothetical protein BY458DRAFT_442916 [Sporodiniella umbellata]KAI9254091.1 hypothetical protein BY458DRAFT_481113 [Sporodiniella umbellata]
MWRPRSDIGRLQYQDVQIKSEGSQYSITLHSREPKETQVKSTTLGEYTDQEICSIHTLMKFITKTAVLRQHLPTNHTLESHSIRAASYTKAAELGNNIQAVKKHANWSLNSDTFEKFYFKPSSQKSSTAIINNSIFSTTEKRITFSAFVSSTLVN